MKKYIYHLVIFLILGSSACSEEIKPTPVTFQKIFSGSSSKTWKIQFFHIKQEGKATQAIDLTQYCFPGDRFTFYDNGRYTVSTDCSDEIPVDDNWSFVNAKATLTMIFPFFGDFTLPFFVDEVTESKLTLEIFIDQENTTSYQIGFVPVTN